MERKLNRIADSDSSNSPDSGEIKKVLFHSLLSYLSKKEGPLSKAEIKDLLLNSLNLIKGFRVEWAEIRKFGKGKLLVEYHHKMMILDMEDTINSILKLWENYLDAKERNSG
ncbi:hypothetical protein LEP1GSC047_3377 [Leptospira inadai serovar Lyme str. 10]|uniref:Uncharacterized protein n=2 Tax=Leptospira inadai serovar Lyme TaxID=293084 RepID=V6HTS0_9LEPT|nr:hypothetical protein [Leptospira inadai]EQA36114.1 hypothetical protein LEP1GSC047_3377 [Leptospira inadai serovar Lyme str. 10]PNV74849.1 hypothetical protein BES34_011280 [Leptospira inadai serovar Lyme]